VRVALADDSTLFRDGLAALLTSAGVEVVLGARTGEELLARLPTMAAPDVAVLDIRMPPTFTDEGLATAIAVRERFRGIGVLVLSTYAETAYAARLLEAADGAIGYLLKDRVDDVATLLDALHRIDIGVTVVDPDIVRRLLVRRRQANVLGKITQRERDVLELMAQGRSNAGIAGELHLGVKTVERHIANLFEHLGIAGDSNANRRVLAVLTWLRSTTNGSPQNPRENEG
jgi:DNA-binding NarL/FixJ family response regulator